MFLLCTHSTSIPSFKDSLGDCAAGIGDMPVEVDKSSEHSDNDLSRRFWESKK